MTAAFIINNLSVHFKRREVLRIPELTFEAGKITAVIGPSGSGKTTLLRTLNMLQKPASGEIIMLGSPLFNKGSYRECQCRMTLVAQKPALFSGTVRYNVTLGLKLRGPVHRTEKAKVDRALKLVGVEKLADQPANTLSGGEAQRVALARALVLEPKVLLLDEPTANLDPANVRVLEELIKQIHRELGNTIVMVTHNFYQARRLSDRTVLLYEGQVIEHRPTAEFFEAPSEERTRAFLAGEIVY